MKDLSVYYGNRRGIHHVNLSVAAGEVFGFLGPNGAGKTTAIRVLLDIIRPSSGKAAIFGLDCQKDGVKIRRKVGYIPGELSLYRNQTAHEYFKMVNAVRGKTTDPVYLQNLCDRLELDPRHQMRTYSRGNKQKIGLVAAFMGKPDLLILDEPTSGLDPLIQQHVLSLVRETRADGRTVFLSSHVLSEVQAICDRVGIIREGQIIATEQVERLIRSQIHRLSLHFERMPPEGAFEFSGAREIIRTNQVITLEIQKNLNQVLSQAVEYGVVDLEDHPVTLEEVFLAYYGKKAGYHHG